MATLPSNQPERIARSAAIRRLRDVLVLMTDEEHSICRVAAERGIFCKGFKRYSDGELRERYSWLVNRDPSISRPRLEDLADRWQLARQVFDDVPIACDAQQIEHDTCGGWDEFSDDDLARFCRELLHENVIVV
ncbi:MAG TPA: hypothetical protein VLV48_01575 [Thermoanaerobaculia bacterium]|nr:hypothetical protein [Thermoanaerobaculia bacterium]